MSAPAAAIALPSSVATLLFTIDMYVELTIARNAEFAAENVTTTVAASGASTEATPSRK